MFTGGEVEKYKKIRKIFITKNRKKKSGFFFLLNVKQKNLKEIKENFFYIFSCYEKSQNKSLNKKEGKIKIKREISEKFFVYFSLFLYVHISGLVVRKIFCDVIVNNFSVRE